MKINKYFKFLIYFWTDLLFGAASLLSILFFLLALGFFSVGGSSGDPLKAIIGTGLAVISAYGILLVFWSSVCLWFGPTLILLILGLLSAPKEEEDRSGTGKLAFSFAVALVVLIVGMLLFLIWASDKNTQGIGFLALVVTFLLEYFFVAINFGNEKPADFEGDTKEISIRNSRYSDNTREEEELKTSGSYKRFMPKVQETEEKVLNNSSLYCSQCGRKISDRDIFCKYCGNKL